MKKITTSTPLILFSTLAAAVCLSFMGCEISDGDETVRQVSLQIGGTYQNSAGIASEQSGEPITSLTLQQSGDQLDGFDNLGIRWTGTIGRADTEVATITLEGQTSTNVQVVITGQVRVEGTRGVMSGAWLEPAIRSSVSAEAVVAGSPTPNPDPTGTPFATPSATPSATATL